MRKTRSSSDGVRLLGPLRSSSVAGEGRRESKSAFPFGTACTIFQGVVIRVKELYPLLYSQAVFCDLVEGFERLVVRTKSEVGTPQVTAKALDATDDAARFSIERDPVTLSLDCSAGDEHNGANGVVLLLLFEGGAETIHTDIAVERKGRELSVTASQLS